MNITKITIIALAIIASSCGKSFNESPKSEYVNYTLGIDKSSGDVSVFQEIANDKDFLLYDGHNLIHKDELKVIKKYANPKQKDFNEIKSLAKLYRNNEFKIAAVRKSRNQDSIALCVPEGAHLWSLSEVYLYLNRSNMPPALESAIRAGIDMWRKANPGMLIYLGDSPSGDGTTPPATFTTIKFYPSDHKFAASTIGRRPAGQGLVYFSEHCDSVDVAHHIGHVLGYVDENVRPKVLDNYIDINKDAIDYIRDQVNDVSAQILELSLSKVGVQNDTPEFDRYSIMMTPSYTTNPIIESALTAASSPVLVSRSEPDEIFKRNTALSKEDTIRINKVYPPTTDRSQPRDTYK